MVILEDVIYHFISSA